MSVAQLGLSLAAAEYGYLDDIPVERVGSFEANLLAYAQSNYGEFMQELSKSGNFNDEIKDKLNEILSGFKRTVLGNLTF